ncbi:MAG: FKBP-type peptidyl-prolyl cis-trans isomerase [Gallionellaceae bacterium]
MKLTSKLLLALLLSAAFVTTACSKQELPPMTASKVTDLIIHEVKLGTGAEAIAGHGVTVQYTGWLYSETSSDHKGAKFDSSRDRNSPFKFPLGEGRVIKGWDVGVAGMKVGGQRTLIIPPAMGYGSRGAGNVIPANATLIFDVELLDVQ